MLGGGDFKSELFGDIRLEVESQDFNTLQILERQFRLLKKSGVVVYMPVETKKGMATIRFESFAGAKPFSRRVAKTSSLSRSQLIDLETQAGQPLGNMAREQLQAALLPTPRDADKGKAVFVVDNAYYGLVPASLDFENGAILSSLDLDSALKSLDYLNKTHLKPSDFTAYFGYPETDSDSKAIFGDEKTAKVETWSDRIKEVRELSQEFGFRLYGSPELNAFPTKEAVLAEIEKATGIVWVTAHSAGCRVRLAAGKAVEISAGDIADLHLENHPFVIVRACNGNEAGFARAFVSAGAAGVWVNEGKVLASDVNSELRQFMSAAKQGSIADAMRAVKEHSSKAAHGTALHVELRSTKDEYESED